MNKKEIRDIFQNRLGASIISITDSSKGVDQKVDIVETSKGKFVLKIPLREENKISKQELGINKSSSKKIPVPKIILLDKKFLVESYLEGEDLDDVVFDRKDFEQIYFELGEILRKIHTIKGENFGDVVSNKLIGNFSTQKKAIESWFKNDLQKLVKLDYFSKEELSRIFEKYENNKHYLNTKKSVMLHSDFADYNIRINNRKIEGIMDFADLSVGPPMQDFARMYIDHSEDYKFEKLLEGYRNYDLEEIKFYAFCWSVWKIYSMIENRKFTKKFYRLKKILLD